MRTNYIKLFISGIFFFLFSCNESKYQNSQTFSISSFPEKIYLKGEIIDSDEIIMPSYIYIKDSLLFTINMRQSYLVSVFNVSDMTRIGDFIEFGSGPNEALIVDGIQFIDSLVWIIDQGQRQANCYPWDQFVQESEAIPLETIRLNESFNKLLVTKNKLVANSFLHIHSRLSFYDMQGNYLENKGELPNAGMQMTELELFESYFCNMALNPIDESIFVAYMNTDLIEIYDSGGNLKTRMHGPDKFFPANREKSVGDGAALKVGFVAGKSRFAYMYPVAFEDEIWTTYNGKFIDPRNDKNFYFCNQIIVFNWDGIPIRHYTTDIAFYGIAIDRKNRTIYGVTINPEYSFVKFRF